MQDTGFIGNKRCSCFEQRLIDKAYQQSNLHKLLEKENFDTFRIDYYSDQPFEGEEINPRKNMEGILLDCMNYAKEFDRHQKSFSTGAPDWVRPFFHAIAKDLLEKGKIVLYQTASDLIDYIRNHKFDQNGREEDSLLERILLSDLLIIDDLGTEYITEFSKMELFNIINKRLLMGNRMIISTNLSLRELSGYPQSYFKDPGFELYKFYGRISDQALIH